VTPNTQKRTARKLFGLAGCPVDCLGLTEVVTLVAPRLTFLHAGLRVLGILVVPVPADMRREDLPKLTDCLREMFPIPPTKGSSRTPLRATALRLSHLTWSRDATTMAF
jgi:hypothetical protein